VDIIKPIALFAISALFEIFGAYMIWQWRREGMPALFALVGVIALFLYSFIQTAQEFTFGRAFAAYGGVFIAAATLWGWLVDGRAPDLWDWIGVLICLFGVGVILVAHRS